LLDGLQLKWQNPTAFSVVTSSDPKVHRSEIVLNLRWVPWAFFADLLLACVPLIDAKIVHGYWASMIAKRADLALALFAMEPHCLLDQEPPDAQRKDFVGPFRLMDHIGQRHRVYIHHAHIDEIQARMSQELD
jgi:hypothetical protein